MSDIIQFRRGTAAGATSSNPTLTQGEPGYETDTGKLKIGDGSTAWTSLPYFKTDSIWEMTAVAGTETATPDFATNELLACNTDDGNIIINLPECAGFSYVEGIILRFDSAPNAYTVTVNAYAGEFIQGESSMVISYSGSSMHIIGVSGAWIIY